MFFPHFFIGNLLKYAPKCTIMHHKHYSLCFMGLAFNFWPIKKKHEYGLSLKPLPLMDQVHITFLAPSFTSYFSHFPTKTSPLDPFFPILTIVHPKIPHLTHYFHFFPFSIQKFHTWPIISNFSHFPSK